MDVRCPSVRLHSVLFDQRRTDDDSRDRVEGLTGREATVLKRCDYKASGRVRQGRGTLTTVQLKGGSWDGP